MVGEFYRTFKEEFIPDSHKFFKDIRHVESSKLIERGWEGPGVREGTVERQVKGESTWEQTRQRLKCRDEGRQAAKGWPPMVVRIKVKTL